MMRSTPRWNREAVWVRLCQRTLDLYTGSRGRETVLLPRSHVRSARQWKEDTDLRCPDMLPRPFDTTGQDSTMIIDPSIPSVLDQDLQLQHCRFRST